jgi:hypothetical protein
MGRRVFIGSSSEGVRIARAIRDNLDCDFECKLWEYQFEPSGVTIDTLLEVADETDWGIFVLTPDDHTEIRDREHLTPRDNVIFEAGLFMGRFGKASVFLVTPSDVPTMRLPSDFLGMTLVRCSNERLSRRGRLKENLGAVSNEIREMIHERDIGGHSLKHEVKLRKNGGNYPLKLFLELTNNSMISVVITDVFFLAFDPIRRAPNAVVDHRRGRVEYPLRFRQYQHGSPSPGHHIKSSFLLREGDTIDTYVGMDPSQETEIRAALGKGKLGEVHMMCYWLGKEASMQHHVIVL